MNVVIWIFILLLLAAAIYLFLVAPRMIHKPDVSVLRGVHYAHRGLHDNKTDAPENSMKAFQLAVDAGYGIEMDVQLSKDEVPVVFHDESLKRMCGVEGKVWEYTLEELQQMKLADSEETIPTFEKVLELVGGKVPLIVEYKLDVPSTRVCELADPMLQKYKGIYCIESFHPFAVRWYRKHRPEVIRGQLSQNFMKLDKYKGKFIFWMLSNLLTNVLTRPDFIAYNHNDYKDVSRNVCTKLGALPVAYTVRSQEEYEKVKGAFDLFIFDSFILENR